MDVVVPEPSSSAPLFYCSADLLSELGNHARSREEWPLVGRILVRTDNGDWLLLILVMSRCESSNNRVLTPWMGELFNRQIGRVFYKLNFISSPHHRHS